MSRQPSRRWRRNWPARMNDFSDHPDPNSAFDRPPAKGWNARASQEAPHGP
jgi:hypothetical protein